MESKHRGERDATQINEMNEKVYQKREVEELRLDRCSSRRPAGARVRKRLKNSFAASHDLYKQVERCFCD